MPLIIALSLLVISELSVQEGKEAEFLELVNSELEVSRGFSGNQGFDIYVENDKPGKVLFIEQWETQEDFQNYYAWRLEQGDFTLLGSYFSAPPVMRQYGVVSKEEKQ